MDQSSDLLSPDPLAEEMVAELRALPVRNAPSERAVNRKYSRRLQQASPELMLDLARTLLKEPDCRWHAYELIANHREAARQIGSVELEELGQGIDSWDSVDAFARILAGPAWLRGQVPDEQIVHWAQSEDRWWRRAALVSTVALNLRSQGGRGDVRRTLKVCRLLVKDHDDMVVKAMSWALRALAVHDAEAVSEFLKDHEKALAARVKREVRNKIATGRKNPGRGRS
jgi:3-methyladenine DNA glycosylase AlkD